MLSTRTIKIILLFTLWVFTFLFSMLPVWVMTAAKKQIDRTKKRRLKVTMSLLSCYSAGVFLATCLLDLFPEVQENMFRALDSLGVRTNFPVPEFVVCWGLFLILIVEQTVLTFKGKENDPGYQPLLSSQDSLSSIEDIPRRRQGSQLPVYVPADQPTNRLSGSDYDSEILHLPEETAEEDHGDALEELNESQMYQDPNSHSVIRSLILLVALSLHSVFEGLAIGLQTRERDVLGIFATIALHKSILAFSLGMNLVQTDMSKKGVIESNAAFSVASPIGIGIGIAVVNFAPASSITTLINGTLQGIACGTFLYIVFFEILPHEFMNAKRYPARLLKVFLMLLGFATVVTIMFFEPVDDLVRCIGG